ncbi:hypothetical protein V4C53_24195 [Paraburkholderia azotifigens]
MAVPLAHALTRAAWHGEPMIPVFSGTVISLEKDGGHAARG